MSLCDVTGCDVSIKERSCKPGARQVHYVQVHWYYIHWLHCFIHSTIVIVYPHLPFPSTLIRPWSMSGGHGHVSTWSGAEVRGRRVEYEDVLDVCVRCMY